MRRLLYILSIVAIVASSCEKLNETPVFSDSDAFVKINKPTMGINENAGILRIPVTLVSASGIATSVTYKVTDGTAKVNDNYTLVDATKTLTFTAENRTQNIEINIVNLALLYTGDLKFTVEIEATGTVKMGSDNKCTVTIQDLDHPLTPILGDYDAVGTSYFNGSEQWTVTLAKDATDVTKVWISNFVKGGSSLAVYGVVDAEMTIIKVPVYQVIATSSSYPLIRLEGYYGPDGATEIPSGGFITLEVAADKSSIAVKDEIGSRVWKDADATQSAGWYNIFAADIVLTKK